MIVRPLAESDLDSTAQWYVRQSPGLELRFLDAVALVLSRIRAGPMQFPEISSGVRRALLHTFPYAVYFRAADEGIIVLAVLHLRRDPRTWQDRS